MYIVDLTHCLKTNCFPICNDVKWNQMVKILCKTLHAEQINVASDTFFSNNKQYTKLFDRQKMSQFKEKIFRGKLKSYSYA